MIVTWVHVTGGYGSTVSLYDQCRQLGITHVLFTLSDTESALGQCLGP
jgi:hypothetical protein